jgi:hypothetical protein
VRGPGVTPGGRCPALISTLDLVPLFYRTCGLEPPPVVQGIDPTPLLRDPSAPGRFWRLTLVRPDGRAALELGAALGLMSGTSLDGISGGAAVFDPEKLDWFNAQGGLRWTTERT